MIVIIYAPAGPPIVEPREADFAVSARQPSVSAGASLAPPAVVIAINSGSQGVGLGVIPPPFDVTIAPSSPFVSAGASVAPQAGSVGVVALSLAVVTGVIVKPPAVAIAVAGASPAVAAGKSVSPPATNIAFAVLAPRVFSGATVAPPAVNIAESTNSPAVGIGAVYRGHTIHLLPANSTRLERAISESLGYLEQLGAAADSVRGFKFRRPLNPSIAPWLVAEYGLGPISAYFNGVEALISAGIPWQRIRGTPLAIVQALGWIGYDTTTLEDHNSRRLKWNRYQVGMGKVPAVELPVLRDAEYLAGLSDPARSVFSRGWHGYDFRTLEWSQGKWGNAIWGDDSGVRVDGGTVKWSHGEELSGTITAGPSERVALGVDVHQGDPVSWGDFPWTTPGLTWNGVADVVALKTFLMLRLPVYVGFYDEAGMSIGYRRPIAVSDVTTDHPGSGESIFVEVECRTGFGDGEGRAAASCALVFRAHPADLTKPGKLWLEPDEIEFEDGFDPTDMKVGSVPADFLFRRTVRHHATLTLEI
ncbi:MAG: hypothetical protein EOS72_03045 [Mesorhizobium sp.]|nr:MAG: hypothetical protein EOS72_03045 [Mesorhizobium sp.]